MLNNRISNKKEIVIEENADSVNIFFKKAADLCKKSPFFESNEIACLLKAIVAKESSGIMSMKKEEKLCDFFRYLSSLSPQASMFASANYRLGGKAVSDR